MPNEIDLIEMLNPLPSLNQRKRRRKKSELKMYTSTKKEIECPVGGRGVATRRKTNSTSTVISAKKHTEFITSVQKKSRSRRRSWRRRKRRRRKDRLRLLLIGKRCGAPLGVAFVKNAVG